MEFVTIEGLITINATIIAQLVHFFILLFILNRLMFRPILRIIQDREAYSKSKIKEIKDICARTEQLKLDIIAKENDARKEASVKRSLIRDEGISETETLLKKSRSSVKAIKDKADQDAESEIVGLKSHIKDEVSSLSEEIMIKVIGRRAMV